MESRKRGANALLLILLIIAIIIIIVMGYFLFNFYNTKKSSDNKVANLTQQLSDSELKCNELQGKIDTISNTINGISSDISNTTSTDTNNANNQINVTYTEETYTTQNKTTGKVVAESKRNLPTVTYSSNPTVASKIETSLKEISDKEWEDIKKSSDDSADLEYTDLGASYIFTTEYTSEKTITIRATLSGGFGGVSWDLTQLYCYDLASGNLLSLSDIATDNSKFSEFVYNKFVEYVNTNNIDVFENWKTELKNQISDGITWGFTKDGIDIIVPRYSIAPGASGDIGISLTKSDYESYLKAEYK